VASKKYKQYISTYIDFYDRLILKIGWEHPPSPVLSPEDELAQILSREITEEINREIIRTLYALEETQDEVVKKLLEQYGDLLCD
jgi:hypothetical protein